MAAAGQGRTDIEHQLAEALLAQPVIAVDGDLRIVLCNEPAALLCGIDRAGALGSDATATLPEALGERLRSVAAGRADNLPLLFGVGDPNGWTRQVCATFKSIAVDSGPLHVAQLQPARGGQDWHLQQLSAAMHLSDGAVMLVSAGLRITYVNEGFTRLFGYRADESAGHIGSELLGGAHTDPESLAEIRRLVALGGTFRHEVLLYRKDGRPLWISLISTPFGEVGQDAPSWLTVLTDITHSKMHEVLHSRVLDAMVRERPIGEVLELICVEFERVAPELATSVMALDPDGRLRAQAAPSLDDNCAQLFDGIRIGANAGACGHAAWRAKPVSVRDMLTDPLFAAHRALAVDHGLRACWSSPVTSSGGRVLGTFTIYYRQPRDPDPWHIRLAETCLQLCALALEREQARARVHQLAFYDSLTALPNRMMFSARSEQLLVNAERLGQPVAVMFLDIDRFKRVNETQGHAAGDGLLRDVTERVTAALSANDLVGRQAGDEFVLAVPQCSPEQAAAIAERLLVAIGAPTVVGRMTLNPGASIGVAMFPQDGRDIDTLLRHADLAMHRAKGDGGGGVCFFSADMNRLAQERVALETALREAIRMDQLHLHYQPQVGAEAPHAVHGVEVLLRWNHPQFGPVSPARFIPLAEESGLIDELARWALRNASNQLADWRRRGVPVPRLAVNLSASNFEDATLLGDLLEHLDGCGLLPDDITLEMTESAMLSPQPGVFDNIRAMRDAGFLLSLDDFGTGYSSLSHLHRLPIGELKLDMAFVRDLEYSEAARALTSSVLRIGENLGKQVIAEGVENEAQRALLAQLGCEVLQGYLFSRPLAAADLETWLRERS